MPIQVGKKYQVPIINKTIQKVKDLSSQTLENYFYIQQGSPYGWSYKGNNGVSFSPNNLEVHSSTATLTLTAKYNLKDIIITADYITEDGYDKVSLKVGDNTCLNAVSGISPGYISEIDALKEGEQIILTYAKDGSTHATNQAVNIILSATLYYEETIEEILGYEEKILPCEILELWNGPYRIIKGFVNINNNIKQFYSFEVDPIISYSADYEDLSTDSAYIYLLKGTGTLNLSGSDMEVWLCGGGGCGASSKSSTGEIRAGGGGGGAFIDQGVLPQGTYNVSIGSGGYITEDMVSWVSSGNTTIIRINQSEPLFSANGGKEGLYGNGGNGSTGGGAGTRFSNGTPYYGTPGTGMGKSTTPFGFTEPFCAGGGGGTANLQSFSYWIGGNGGTNGESGQEAFSGAGMTISSGGNKGGGSGGSQRIAATNATWYGSGGGGAGTNVTGSSSFYSGGAGYSGCVILYKAKK